MRIRIETEGVRESGIEFAASQGPSTGLRRSPPPEGEERFIFPFVRGQFKLSFEK